MSEYFKRLSIKNKIFCVIAATIIMTILLSFVILNMSFKIYEDTIYEQSGSFLGEVTNSITHELERYEQLSLSIMANNDFQTCIYKINNSSKSFEKYQAVSRIREELKQYSNILSDIMFLSYVDMEGAEYSTISMPDRISIGELVLNEANRTGKTSFWYTGLSQNNILFVQSVKNIENGGMYNAGYLVISVDLTNNVDDVQKRIGKKRSNLLICNENRIINMDSSEAEKFKGVITNLTENKDYDIKVVGGIKYFIVKSVDEHTNWTYIHFMPFEEIVRNIWSLRLKSIIMYIILGCVMLIFSVRMTKSITGNITRLVEKMVKVKQGDFNVSDKKDVSDLTSDEIDILHTEFNDMAHKINILINENYKSRAVISDTKLKALQAQMDPHFLYNTLDTINWMARINSQPEIAKMVKALANLMRNSFGITEKEITVEKEMTLVADYIEIQKIRHNGKLVFYDTISCDAKNSMVPKFSIQPIVENAVKYCVEKKNEPSTIKVVAYIEDEKLTVKVIDDGPGITEEDIEKICSGTFKSHGNGIGLVNIDTRIKMIYGEQYGIMIKSEPNIKTEIGFAIPAETKHTGGM